MEYKHKVLFIAGAIFILMGLILYFIFPRQDLHERSVEFPKEVKVYFLNTNENSALIDCEKVIPVTRIVDFIEIPINIDSDSIIDGELIYLALTELLRGPSTDELEDGFITSINENVRIRHIVIRENVAHIDFNIELEKGSSGSCSVLAIISQISKTVTQFDNIDNVDISIDGIKDGILQP